MTEEEYKAFWHELTTAEAVQPKDFEKESTLKVVCL